MKLKMGQLMDQLKQFHPQGDGNGTELISFSSVCFLKKNTQYNSNEILFIGYASDLLKDFIFDAEVPIVCIEDTPVPEQYQTQKTVLRLPLRTDINAVYDSIAMLLKEDTLEREFMETLYQSILREDEIGKTCDLAREFLQNPIVILDNSPEAYCGIL